MDWKIYYGDESTFSSDEGAPNDAPALNIQVIAQRTKREGRILLSGHDYYWFDPDMDEWVGGDIFGAWDFLSRFRLIKFARSIASKVFETIHRRAANDPDLPPQSMPNQNREGRKDE